MSSNRTIKVLLVKVLRLFKMLLFLRSEIRTLLTLIIWLLVKERKLNLLKPCSCHYKTKLPIKRIFKHRSCKPLMSTAILLPKTKFSRLFLATTTSTKPTRSANLDSRTTRALLVRMLFKIQTMVAHKTTSTTTTATLHLELVLVEGPQYKKTLASLSQQPEFLV